MPWILSPAPLKHDWGDMSAIPVTLEDESGCLGVQGKPDPLNEKLFLLALR